MSGSSKKNDAARRKKVRLKTQQERKYRLARVAAAEFPKLDFQPSVAPKRLDAAIRKAFETIAGNYQKLLSETAAAYFQLMKEHGWRKAAQHFLDHGFDLLPMGPKDFALVELGTLLFKSLPQQIASDFFPYHDIELSAVGNKVHANYRRLETVKFPGGNAYFSPKRPRLGSNGSGPIVAFQGHTIERVCHRCVCDWQSYAGIGAALSYFFDCIYFEPWTYKGEHGFVLYEQYDPAYSDEYADFVPEGVTVKDNWYYKVGYCPCFEENGFIVAITLLVPGMDHTPEQDWYYTHVGGSTEQRAVLNEKVKVLTRDQLKQSRDLSLLKMFHDGGIPQIVQIPGVVFDRSKV